MEKETKKDYEIAFILSKAEAAKSLADVLVAQGAEITYQSPVKETALAYPVKKYSSAQFGFNHFQADGEAIAKIKAALTLTQDVLRFIIITPPVKMASATSQQKPERKATAPIVSNEALSEKLEEILK